MNSDADTQNSGPADESSFRRIVSFVRREGRLTKGQSRALDELWPVYGIEYKAEPLDLAAIFGNSNPVVFEIGFGMGRSLLEMAEAAPEVNFLGTEVHRPGIGACLMGIRDKSLSNIRVMDHDAVEILKNMLPSGSLQRLQLYFPDPWHKKKHHKRRIVQVDFLQLVASRLVLGGVIHMATDWQEYAEHMRDAGNACGFLKNLSHSGDFVPRPDFRPVTKFEERGLRLGHGVWDLMFEKAAEPDSSPEAQNV
ncbi:MAG: tRNA (guanosine(46)-N7)-methyltransferase TrmB [Succinivibrionaceae bacterium]|nr:tRNA (guanosine(46)-N7)-methyltransferase TrmB [Succinivibrionaceae bacterium]